ncbi:hypothetical protein GGQ72_001013 [Rhizobium rhizoryzae]|jgi:hypothetical protein|uniref:Uncharacterized protein n=1 Tax=Rhizobium rhizoryzae TaxID=451876 RepID=A0A7W6PQ37_9HYPH|nr:hypothetical protein [Rhizobium rhizoryzae]
MALQGRIFVFGLVLFTICMPLAAKKAEADARQHNMALMAKVRA